MISARRPRLGDTVLGWLTLRRLGEWSPTNGRYTQTVYELWREWVEEDRASFWRRNQESLETLKRFDMNFWIDERAMTAAGWRVITEPGASVAKGMRW